VCVRDQAVNEREGTRDRGFYRRWQRVQQSTYDVHGKLYVINEPVVTQRIEIWSSSEEVNQGRGSKPLSSGTLPPMDAIDTKTEGDKLENRSPSPRGVSQNLQC